MQEAKVNSNETTATPKAQASRHEPSMSSAGSLLLKYVSYFPPKTDTPISRNIAERRNKIHCTFLAKEVGPLEPISILSLRSSRNAS